jgi:MSHA biogenesis protein MshE
LIGYLAQAREALFAIPFVNLDDYPSLKEAHKLLPTRIAAACEAVVVEQLDGAVKVALVNPHDTAARDFLQEVLRPHRVEFVATSLRDFERYRDLHLGRVSASSTPTEEDVGPLAYVDHEGVAELLGEHETGQLLRQALTLALHFGASDIHFEPGTPEGRVRLRLDGKMTPLPDPVPARVFDQAVSRLKVMSGLDITEKRLPQDGRFPLRVGDRQIEVRVSVTPCQGGEKVVLRLLDAAHIRWDLDSLILSRPVGLLVKELFLAHSGLLLVCGPTGAGKTTTLYAGLQALWNDSHAVNIVTAEDPVEYQLGYATQIGVNRAVGLDFDRVLRSILRQDPDVILVGEIRDEESAAIALEAAATGHMVLSSLHTDSALESITRLRNLQVKPYLLAAGLRGVVCQKLVPRVCKNCAAEVPADDPQVARLRTAGVLPADWSKPLSRGRGCDSCRSEGEIGRVGVFEVLDVNDPLREAIEANAPSSVMRDALTSPVFVPMAQYARYLLEQGVVSPERIREIFPARGSGD